MGTGLFVFASGLIFLRVSANFFLVFFFVFGGVYALFGGDFAFFGGDFAFWGVFALRGHYFARSAIFFVWLFSPAGQ